MSCVVYSPAVFEMFMIRFEPVESGIGQSVQRLVNLQEILLRDPEHWRRLNKDRMLNDRFWLYVRLCNISNEDGEVVGHSVRSKKKTLRRPLNIRRGGKRIVKLIMKCLDDRSQLCPCWRCSGMFDKVAEPWAIDSMMFGFRLINEGEHVCF